MGRSVPKIPRHRFHKERVENPWQASLAARSQEPKSVEWGQIIGAVIFSIIFLAYGFACMQIGQQIQNDNAKVVGGRK